MQQLNALPISISQGSDLKDENRFLTSVRSESNDDFSLLVEQHVTDKSKSKIGNKNVDKIDVYKEKNSIRDVSTTSDEGNSIAANTEKNIATSGNAEKDSAEEEQSSLSEEVLLDSTTYIENKDDFSKKVALTESQKFISLLYAADKTLINEADNITSDNVITEDVNSDSEQEKALLTGKNATKSIDLTDIQKASTSSDKTIQNVSTNSVLNQEVANGSKTIKVAEKALTSTEIDKLLTTNKALNATLSPELIDKENKAISDKLLNPLLGQKNEGVDKSDIGSSAKTSTKEADASMLNNKYLKGELHVNDKPPSSSLTSVELKEMALDKNLSALQQVVDAKNSKKSEVFSDLSHEADVESIKLEVNKALAGDIKDTRYIKQPKDGEQFILPIEQPKNKPDQDQIIQQTKTVVDHLNRPLNSQTDQQQIAHQMKYLSQEEETISQDSNDIQADEADSVTEGVHFSLNDIDIKTKKSPSILDVNKIDAHTNTRLYTDVATSSTTQINDSYVSQQSAELLSYSVASDTAQIQKNNVSLQQETISIFRKDFADALKDKVMLVISQKLQQFDISLDPPELGNMQVRVNMQGEQAVVNFVVQNQQAKDALEQNMHKLRDMLSEQGVDVGDANVEQQAHQSSDEETYSNNSDNSTLMDEDEMIQSQTLLSAQTLDNNSANVVDYYA